MKTAAQEEVYGAVNITADKRVELQVSVSDAESEATKWSIADIDRIVRQLEREILCITSNEQMLFKKALSICLIEFEAAWLAINVQELWKTIEQRVINFEYPRMPLMRHISESIRRMASCQNDTTHISGWLYIRNVKEP